MTRARLLFVSLVLLLGACGTVTPPAPVPVAPTDPAEDAAKSFTFKQVSAGFTYTCGVTVSGSVKCWGDDDAGRATPPEGTFSQVSAGSFHTCGLTTSGSVKCWGDGGSD